MRLVNNFKVEFMHILNIKLTYVILIGATIHNYIVYKERFDLNMPYDALIGTSYSVQAIILGFILIGIYIQKKEEEGNMIEVLKSINSAIFIKMIAKLLTIITLIFIYIIMNFIVLIIVYKTEYIKYYYDAFYYLILFWGLPFFIAALAGYLISSLVKGKFVYITSLIAWVLLTPINNTIFMQLNSLGIESAFEISDFLNLTQNNPNMPTNSTYGLSLEVYQLIKRIFIAVIFITINLLVMYKKGLQTKKTFKICFSSLSIIIVLLSIGTFKEQQVITYGNQYNSVNRKDIDYYQNIRTEKKYDINFDILEYDMSLNIDGNLKNEVIIKLVNNSKQDQTNVHFLLYNALKINEVLLNGEKLKFNREGDNLTINFNNYIKPNEIAFINIKYSGVTSPKYFANKTAIYLPNIYPWYPVLSEYNSIMSLYGISSLTWNNYIKPKGEVKYRITLNKDYDIYTNLNKVTSNTWKGTSKDGIYIIKGVALEKEINNRKFVYPLNLEKNIEELNELDLFIGNVEKIINSDFKLNNNIKKVMILDTKGHLFDYSSNEGFWVNNTLGISYKDFKSRGLEGIFSSIISSLTNKNLDINSNDYTNIFMFDLAYSAFVGMRIGIPIENSDFAGVKENIDINIDNLYESRAYSITLNKLNSFLVDKNISENKKINFFRMWYEMIKSDNVLNDKEILDLLKRGN